MNQTRRDVGGPVIAVCAGQRCRALRELRGPEAGIEPLKAAVGQTRGAVLISTGCLGRCNLAAVVVLVWRGEVGCDPIPLAGMDSLDRSRASADTAAPDPVDRPPARLQRVGPLRLTSAPRAHPSEPAVR